MIYIHVLGAPVVRRHDGPVSGRAAHRRRLALVAVLAAARGRPVGRERVIGLLWADNPGDAARHNISEALYVLRKELGDASFVVRGDEVGLDPAHAHSDLDDFERAVEEGRWEDAVRAYGGPFLDGFYVSDAPEFERWAEGERDRLARACGRALEELALAAEAAGVPLRAAEWWRRLLAHDAFSSRVVLRLVRVLERAGERAAAVRAGEAHVLLLREELGVEPDPELSTLLEDLRRAPPAPPRPALPAAASEDEPADDASALPASGQAVPAESAESAGGRLDGVGRGLHDAEAARARSHRRRFGIAAAGLGLVAAVLGMVALATGRGADPPPPAGYDPRRIAVLYLDDDSPGGDLQYLANGLTEMLIHELSQVGALDVISRNGVKPYRPGTIPFDTMVAQLRVGSVVEGSVARSGDSVRVTVQLIDANTGSHLVSRKIVRPLGDLLALQHDVAEEVSGFLRGRLGAQVRMRQAAAETRSGPALELVLRGEEAYASALALYRSQDTADIASARQVLAEADRLLARAEAADPRWPRPTVARAWVALREASWSEALAQSVALDSAVARAERVLARRPQNGRALEARGTAHWKRALAARTDTAALMQAAERDLRAALAAEPGLASAWWTLSQLQYTQGRRAASVQSAERALEHDAWLEEADRVMTRLYYAYLTLGDFPAAAQACDRGYHAFPRRWEFVECRLTLMRRDTAAVPDTALAWRLVAQLDSLDPPALATATGRAYTPIFRRMVAAAISARAGDTVRARDELARARLDAALRYTTRASLAYDEAVLLRLLGDHQGARERLRVFLAQDPAERAALDRDPLVRGLLTAGGATAP